jgi:hypothetical protein
MLGEKADYLVKAAHLVVVLDDVVPLILEDEKLDVFALGTQLLNQVAGLLQDHARVIGALDDKQGAGQWTDRSRSSRSLASGRGR